jgi:hypothetical protein
VIEKIELRCHTDLRVRNSLKDLVVDEASSQFSPASTESLLLDLFANIEEVKVWCCYRFARFICPCSVAVSHHATKLAIEDVVVLVANTKSDMRLLPLKLCDVNAPSIVKDLSEWIYFVSWSDNVFKYHVP